MTDFESEDFPPSPNVFLIQAGFMLNTLELYHN